ncbi:MAG: hypothetical protein EBU90_04755 [Proteobacteria bacterium]|nr:hypothetical protein [Pseudomonadota bacterium]NBP13772.1 hypothetical protein [bacterium]
MYFPIIFIVLAGSVWGHSAPSCTDKRSDGTCVGFARYYYFNHLPTPLPSSNGNAQFFASRDRELLIQPGVDRICPEMQMEAYNADFPMATAQAGDTLTLQHPPRGHSKQPSSPVWIYMYPQAGLFPQVKQPRASDMKLVAEYPFDNCVGVEQEVSWANCTGTMTLPSTMSPGIYTFQWRWDLNGIPYSDCFEVDVKAAGGVKGNNTQNRQAPLYKNGKKWCLCDNTP